MRRLRTTVVLLALAAASLGWGYAVEACVKITGSTQGVYPAEAASAVCQAELAPDTSFTARSIHHLLRSDDGSEFVHEALVMSKFANASTTKLWRSLKNDEALTVEILIVAPDDVSGTIEPLLKLTLQNARVVGIEPIAERNDAGIAISPDREKVQFEYGRIEIARPGGAESVTLSNPA